MAFRLRYNLTVQFSVATVREVAQLLTEAGLGEITLEATGTGGGPAAARLTLRRSLSAVADEVDEAAELVATSPLGEEAAEATDGGPQPLLVSATAVGVFRPAKPALEVGVVVKKRQFLGLVEALKIPNEVYAPEAGQIVEILAAEGQGVEWGQPLFAIVPQEKK